MKRSVILILTLLVLFALSLYSFAEDTTPPDTTIASGSSGEIDSSSNIRQKVPVFSRWYSASKVKF